MIAVLVIAGFAVGGFIGGGGGVQQADFDTGGSTRYVSGVGTEQPIVSQGHVPNSQNVEYSTFPPTSGDHWDETNLVACGFYEGGLPDEIAVHHLEHGNIVVSYNLPDQAQVEDLRQLVGGVSLAENWGVTRSYDKISEGHVATSAWGVVDVFNGVDEGRIRTFFETYAGTLGPEFDPCT